MDPKLAEFTALIQELNKDDRFHFDLESIKQDQYDDNTVRVTVNGFEITYTRTADGQWQPRQHTPTPEKRAPGTHTIISLLTELALLKKQEELENAKWNEIFKSLEPTREQLWYLRAHKYRNEEVMKGNSPENLPVRPPPPLPSPTSPPPPLRRPTRPPPPLRRPTRPPPPLQASDPSVPVLHPEAPRAHASSTLLF